MAISSRCSHVEVNSRSGGRVMRALMLLSAVFFATSSRPNGMKIVALGLTGLLALAMLFPQPAIAQFDLLGSITAIFNVVNQVASSVLGFINDTMRPLLQGIQSATQALQSFLGQLRNLWEQVVWPISEINRAKALAQQLIATFRGLLNNLYSIGVNSAQLPNSVQLESVMRNHQ